MYNNILTSSIDIENLLTSSIEINWKTFGLVLAIFLGIAVIFSVLILVITNICKVDEDKKVAAILERLGGSNCGGCGCSGCAAFAEKLARGEGDVHDCHSTSQKNAREIALILNVSLADEEPTVSVVKCSGGHNAKDRFSFAGYSSCSVLSSTFQLGHKECAYGCLGGADCKERCPHDAIRIIDGVSHIDRSRCTACGACLRICPKNLIERIPRSASVYVACSTKCKGKEVMNGCSKGCIACGMCAKVCPQQAITMVDNLPVIDYKKCVGCKACAAKCPRKVIVEI